MDQGGFPEFVVPDDLSGWLDGDAATAELPSRVGEIRVIAALDVAPASPYVPQVEPSDDVAIPLPGDKALRYAMAVLAAAWRARYFAAVLAQSRAMMGRNPQTRERADENAKYILAQLLKDLPELDDEATAPLRFVPVVKMDGSPAVKVSLPPHDEVLAGWSFEDACEHAHAVLAQSLVSHLDTAYRTVISVGFEAGEQRGQAAVGLLSGYFQPAPARRVPFVKPAPKVPGPAPGARKKPRRRR